MKLDIFWYVVFLSSPSAPWLRAPRLRIAPPPPRVRPPLLVFLSSPIFTPRSSAPTANPHRLSPHPLRTPPLPPPPRPPCTRASSARTAPLHAPPRCIRGGGARGRQQARARGRRSRGRRPPSCSAARGRSRGLAGAGSWPAPLPFSSTLLQASITATICRHRHRPVFVSISAKTRRRPSFLRIRVELAAKQHTPSSIPSSPSPRATPRQPAPRPQPHPLPRLCAPGRRCRVGRPSPVWWAADFARRFFCFYAPTLALLLAVNSWIRSPALDNLHQWDSMGRRPYQGVMACKLGFCCKSEA